MEYQFDASYALKLDKEDELAKFRAEFYIPEQNGQPVNYFTGNSLGLQPKTAGEEIQKDNSYLRTSLCQRPCSYRTPCRCVRTRRHICALFTFEGRRRALYRRFRRAWCAYHHQSKKRRRNPSRHRRPLP